MTKDSFELIVKGHVNIVDDLGNVLLDANNAVHPENLARVFARALADESNYKIWRIAYGNGGTTINAAFQVQFNPVNDGQPPDQEGWESRLYHETFSEIVDEGNTVLNPLLGSDPGSADPNTGVRPGGGAVPANDPPTILHVSGPGVRSFENTVPLYTSNVVIIDVLNAAEPTGQYLSDLLGPIEQTNTSNPTAASFTFDEIGLYTTGAPAIASSGYAEVNVGNQSILSDSDLIGGLTYNFHISVDGGPTQPVQFSVPASGGSGPSKGSYNTVYYGDIVVALMTGDAAWNIFVSGNPVIGSAFLGSSASVNISNDGTFNGSIPPAQTFGFLTFTSTSTGPTSVVVVSPGSTGAGLLDLLASLNVPGGATSQLPVFGQAAGVQNAPLTPGLERERLLTHLIFSPVTKAANRTLTITYTLTISVARTPTM